MKSCLDTLFRRVVAQQAGGGGFKIAIAVDNIAAPASR